MSVLKDYKSRCLFKTGSILDLFKSISHPQFNKMNKAENFLKRDLSGLS